MMAGGAWKFFRELLDLEDDPQEPFYDPLHLAAVLVVSLAVMGALYWLLWTLLVYEGGLFIKIGPAAEILLGHHKAADFGYRGSYDPGLFRGWQANLAALFLCALALSALHQLYHQARKRAGGASKTSP